MERRSVALVLLMKLLVAECLIPLNPWSTESTNVCDHRLNECRFVLRSTSLMAMFYKDLYRVVADERGVLSKYDNQSLIYPMEKIITADGYPKMVNVFNDSLPGPTLHFFQEQKIFIEIHNDLPLESLTVHFHGIRQWESIGSDGVPFITQKAILPGESFLHEFVVHDQGTFWYHSHVQSQTAMGLFGALVVHPREMPSNPIEEFVLVLNDWQHFYSSIELEHLVESGQFYPNSVESLMESGTIDYYENVDGSRSAESLVTSLLINGRGNYFDPRTNESSSTPLESIVLPTKNASYRVRVINAGSTFPMKISVDEFQLEVIGSDGVPFNRSILVDELIVGLGERFDLLIHPAAIVSNRTAWWIRVSTLDRNANPRWHSRAILTLNSSGDPSPVRPASEEKICSARNPCRILNCPFDHYGPKSAPIECLTLRDVQSQGQSLDDDLLREDLRLDHRVVLSLVGADSNGEQAGFEGMNKIGMQYPKMSKPFIFAPAEARALNRCENETSEEGQRCYHHLLVQFNETIELLVVNFDTDQHPLHLHGQDFHLVEEGLPVLNGTTGLREENNPNVQCDDDLLHCQCRSCRMNAKVVKDTIIVPSGGYMRIRFRGLNPGIWLFHCHTETHLGRGMSLAIHVAEDRLKQLLTNNSSSSPASFFLLGCALWIFSILLVE